MANIINNNLMCFGKKEELEVLKELLQDRKKAIPILSQDIFGIYEPKNTRNFDKVSFCVAFIFNIFSHLILYLCNSTINSSASDIDMLAVKSHSRNQINVMVFTDEE